MRREHPCVLSAIWRRAAQVAARAPEHTAAIEAPLLCAGLSIGVLAAGWAGSDLPAHVFRAELASRYGLPLWNDQWYGGHYLPAYGPLSPVLGAWLGVRLSGVIACVAATASFSFLVRRRFGARGRIAAVLFALALVPDVIVGRVAFDVGFALALGSLSALETGRRRAAVAAALITPFASPLAAAFLTLATGVGAVVTRSRAAAMIAACSAIPVAVLVTTFSEGGTEPFHVRALVYAGIATVAFAALMPRRERALRVGAVAYAGACVVSFADPSPLGGNVVRLAMAVGAPLVLCAVWQRGRVVAAAAAVLLLGWQWSPAMTAIGASGSDPSSSAAYFAPLVRFLESRPPARVEIPFTRSHWEAAYVAPFVPLARGWERQLDERYNQLFYSPWLTAARYHTWLLRNAVRYVALPDVTLDAASRTEAAVISTRPAYLRPVYRAGHWSVWRVADAPQLAGGPARIEQLTPESVTLEVRRQGAVLVRMHYTPLWAVERGAACLRRARGGWTLVDARPGVVELEVSVSPLRLFGAGAACVR